MGLQHNQEILDDLLAEVHALGLDPGRFLSDHGRRRADSDEYDIALLMAAAAETTGCVLFGARLAQRHDLRTYFGMLGRLVWAAPDLGTALRRFATYVGTHVAGSHYTIDIDGGLARVRNRLDLDSKRRSQNAIFQPHSHNLVVIDRLIAALTNDRCEPASVQLGCSAPPGGRAVRQYTRAPVWFDAPMNAVLFPSSDLDLKLRTNDELLSDLILNHQQFTTTHDGGIVSEVEDAIERNLLAGRRGLDAVLEMIPLSRSALQAQLTSEGTSYQHILDTVRTRLAKDRLAHSKSSVTEIALLLCFSSADTFTVAFKRSTGLSPAQWRRANRSTPIGPAPRTDWGDAADPP